MNKTEIKKEIGKVIELPAPQQWKSGKGFTYSIVIETGGEYSRNVCFSFYKEEMWAAVKDSIGSMVEVFFENSSRKSNDGRWFTDAKAWRINEIGSNKPSFVRNHEDEIPF